MTEEQPYAEIKRDGRWTYTIKIYDDGSIHGPGMSGVIIGWRAWGRKRAEAKARRVLAAYVRKQEQRAETWRVTP